MFSIINGSLAQSCINISSVKVLRLQGQSFTEQTILKVFVLKTHHTISPAYIYIPLDQDREKTLLLKLNLDCQLVGHLTLQGGCFNYSFIRISLMYTWPSPQDREIKANHSMQMTFFPCYLLQLKFSGT